MGTAERVDPYPAFHFYVEVGSIFRGFFTEVGGIDTTIEVTPFPVGGLPHNLKLPGKVNYSNLTLKYGLTSDSFLSDWMSEAAEGNVTRYSGAIVVMDRAGNPRVRWDFREAWPTSWKGPALAAKGSEYAIEEMDLAHEGIKRSL